eukprot:80621-Pleurochrysis_carterae.AAC.1
MSLAAVSTMSEPCRLRPLASREGFLACGCVPFVHHAAAFPAAANRGAALFALSSHHGASACTCCRWTRV